MNAIRLCSVILMTLAVITGLAIGISRMTHESRSSNVLIAAQVSNAPSQSDRVDIDPKTALLLSPEQLLTADTSSEDIVILKLDQWRPVTEFSDVLGPQLVSKIDGIFLDAPLITSSAHVELIYEYFQPGEVFIAFEEFADKTALNSVADWQNVRAHRIDDEEWAMLSDSARTVRIVRAAKERKIELFIIPVENLTDLESRVQPVESALLDAGFSMYPLERKVHTEIPWMVQLLLVLGTVGLLMWIILSIVSHASTTIQWGLLASLAVGGVLAQILISEEISLVCAWLVAVGAPIAAFLYLRGRYRADSMLKESFTWVLGLSGASILGGLVAASFLTESSYLLGIDIFRGVKAALVVPVLAVGLLSVNEMLRSGFGVIDGAVIFIVGAVLAYMLLRSGNGGALDAVGPSGIEQSLRATLEDILYARPRFKEFLIGHPALWVWAGLGAWRWRSWGWGLLLIGLIGQVSIINSFMHLHTPLEFTLLRVFNGLWLGVLLGLISQAGLNGLAGLIAQAKGRVLGS